jgi:ATP-dependent RNA helicase RhlE
MEYRKDPRKRNNRPFNHGKKETANFKNRKKISTKELPPESFIRKAIPVEETMYRPGRLISELPVDGSILHNLKKKGYELPTEIQDKTLEAILEGRNLIGLAQTGTGKTGAFLIPLIHNLLRKDASKHVLVVSPTRELALQTDSEFRSIASGLKLYSTCIIGGTSVRRDIENLRRPGHIIIGTPGRLADMVRQGALDLRRFSVLVLDEFDRLLDMGFAPEDKSQQRIIDGLVENPCIVKVRTGNISAANIEQEIVSVKDGEKKIEVLLEMMRDDSFEKVLVFVDTKRGVSRICRDLRRGGITADEIHGDKSQNYRVKALESFRNRKIKVLVATDVAARGLDISHVSHVINFQQPKDMESYIHRIGRTGRAGASGRAITFVN